jgi:anti-sigma regulatory factor (Ser/Thr protein kinase)
MALRRGRWELPPDPGHIGAVRREVASFAAHAGMAATQQIDLQVAVSDAITSAVLQADGAPDPGPVRVDAEDQGDQLVVRVREPEGRADGRSSCPGVGPRLSMIAALAEDFGVRRCEDGATELSMRFVLVRG